MNINQIYRPSLSLLTDLYQLTMAYGYWKAGLAEQESVFHLYLKRLLLLISQLMQSGPI